MMKRGISGTGGGIAFNELPLIIHVDCKEATEKAIAEVFERHQKAIHEHIEMRTSPYIRVNEDQVIAGPSFAKLLNNLVPTGADQRDNKTRSERRLETYTSRTWSQDPELASSPRRNEVEQKIETNVAHCAMDRSHRANYLTHRRPGHPPLGVRPDNSYLP